MKMKKSKKGGHFRVAESTFFTDRKKSTCILKSQKSTDGNPVAICKGLHFSV